MITYKEFIDKMIEKGYIYNQNPITISNNHDNKTVSTFSVNSGQIGKIIELKCPDSQIMALCGSAHTGGCNKQYLCDIKCYNDQNKEPFQGLHHSTELTKNYHVLAEIIVTKILRNDPPIQHKKVKEWSDTINSILKLIGSSNNREHVMWLGAYNLFSSEFSKSSFTLYGGQKMIFYINNPDIDITKVDLSLDIDILKSNKEVYNAEF